MTEVANYSDCSVGDSFSYAFDEPFLGEDDAQLLHGVGS